ncbi:hypothetical protein FACS1894120_2470 [Clostridia bacterium]|nr:hypothetical protein FACS1894120_2470 [Clostridia bacterium]
MINLYSTNSPEETERVGFEMAGRAKQGEILLLFGDLGGGKTCFVRGLAKGFGISDAVTSPTFTIVNDYGSLLHFDLYRIGGTDDLHAIGFFDYLDRGCALAVEWAERIESDIPHLFRGRDVCRVRFLRGYGSVPENARIIEVEVSGIC